jgi:hypothetical protein
MIGGLLSKSTSRLALLAAAGLFVGGVAMPSAKAADLGGDCCADLEERVAELEATTARKGNRKVSLTVYGWVNKGILYWNDGVQSNTYFGVDNTNYATRFGLRGDAKVNPNVSAGFNILLDIVSGATTSGVRRDREDRNVDIVDKLGQVTNSTVLWPDDHIIRMRDAVVWVEHTALGRLTVGHLTNPGPQGIIDLGGVAVASPAAISLVGGSFGFRKAGAPATTAPTAATIANNTDNVADFSNRTDSIMWTSPSIGGFILSAAAGEAANQDRTVPFLDATSMAGPLGLYWAANIRYAGEFSGFRVAAAAAYERSDGDEKMGSSSTFGISGASTNIGYSASLLHVPSGLFAQGSWINFERPNLDGTHDNGSLWQVQGGIAQNWTGLGKTVLYGEYARGNDLQRAFSPFTASIAAGTVVNGTATLAAIQAVNGENEYTMWGLGIVQNIDAAALELYLTYRRHSLDHNAETTGANALAKVEDIDFIMGGMRIAF